MSTILSRKDIQSLKDDAVNIEYESDSFDFILSMLPDQLRHSVITTRGANTVAWVKLGFHHKVGTSVSRLSFSAYLRRFFTLEESLFTRGLSLVSVFARDYTKTQFCFKKVIKLNPNHKIANYEIGLLYHYGLGVSKNIVKAKKYYKKAEAKGHEDSKRMLLKIEMEENHWSTADEWDQLGFKYCEGKDGKTQDYIKAQLCFEEALKCNSDHTHANSSIAYLYHYGKGVNKNIAKAKKYYKKAASKGDKHSKRRLLEIEMTKKHYWFTADKWTRLGVNYYAGKDGQTQDHITARFCCGKALKLNPHHKSAHYNIAVLYHYGQGVTKDIAKARTHYTKALSNRHLSARKGLRTLEKEEIERMAKNGNLNEKDSNGDTALHRAAKQKFHKHYARLLCLGADPTKWNAVSKVPRYYLHNKHETAKDLKNLQEKHKKINILRNRFTETITKYYTSVPKAMSHAIRCPGTDDEANEKSFNEMYQKVPLKPLLELVKFAYYGYHDLSGYEHYTDDGYTSDNENEINVKDSAHFNISVDPNRETNEGTFCQGGENSVGLYNPGSNTIHIGGKTDGNRKILDVTGTLLHEITHFIAHEVFRNHCKPYARNDQAHQSAFTKISNILEKRYQTLPLVIQKAFGSGYTRNQIHEELIVRVVQAYYTLGSDRVEESVPELWNYYKNVFLPAVEKHVTKLKNRMLSDWSPELFKSVKNHRFHFECKSESLSTHVQVKPK